MFSLTLMTRERKPVNEAGRSFLATMPSASQRFSLSMVAELVLSMRIEAVLVLLAGLMALMTSAVCHRNAYARRYKLIVIGPDDSDVIGWCCVALGAVGLVNIAIGVIKTLRRINITFNQYISIVVVTLVCNFCVGIALTDFKHEVTHGLEDAMLGQLKESVVAKQRFGVGFQLSEAWDFLQIKMMCCGVNAYKDYVDLGGISGVTSDVIPLSCCAMRISANGNAAASISGSGRVEPDNLSQCRLDAQHGVINSVFLHTQGCLSPVSRWMMRYLNRTIAMVFATICLQALGVLYLSWLGFRKSAAYSVQRSSAQMHS